MIRVLIAAAVLAASTAPAFAQTTLPPAAAVPTPSGKDLSGVTVTAKKAQSGLDQKEVVCHKEQVLGTLFPREVCARREDIADRKRADQANLRDAQAQRPWKDEAAAK